MEESEDLAIGVVSALLEIGSSVAFLPRNDLRVKDVWKQLDARR
jgi:hypothetical protein